MTAANQNRAGLIDVWKGIDCEITCIQDSCNVLSPGRCECAFGHLFQVSTFTE